jgi:hypothetical protein
MSAVFVVEHFLVPHWKSIKVEAKNAKTTCISGRFCPKNNTSLVLNKIGQKYGVF